MPSDLGYTGPATRMTTRHDEQVDDRVEPLARFMCERNGDNPDLSDCPDGGLRGCRQECYGECRYPAPAWEKYRGAAITALAVQDYFSPLGPTLAGQADRPS